MSQPTQPDPAPVARARIASDVDWPAVIGTLLTFEPLDPAPRGGDAIAAWVDILHHGRPSARHWRLVAAAIQNADAVLAQHSLPARGRGGRRWCELACDSYRFLASLGPRLDQTDASAGSCYADADAIRTWLSAPTLGGATVAHRLGVATQFASPARVDTHAVARLLAAAQDAGVFGLSGRRIQAHPDRPGRVWLLEHPIVSRHGSIPEPGRPRREELDLGPGRPLTHVDVAGLVQGAGVGVDAAVTVLTRAARVVNATLDPHRTPLGPSRPPFGRPFLASPGESARVNPDPPPQPPQAGQGRHR